MAHGELFKIMDDHSLEKIREILNIWWRDEDLDEEALRAWAALIFEKGDSGDMNNYRPISLLNTIYQLYAGITQRRLAEKLDEHLHAMQFGLRKKRSTRDAIHCVRRIMDKREEHENRHHTGLVGMVEGIRQGVP